MDIEELKKFIRDNLVIDVQPCDPHGPNNSIYIGLRFVGEKDAFCSEHVHIPESAERP